MAVPPELEPAAPVARTVGSSPTPTREGPGRARRRPCTPSGRPSTPGPPASSSTSTPPPTATWWCATTPPSTAPPTAPGRSPTLTLDQVRALDNAYWWAPGADVTPDLEPDRYPFRGRAPTDRRFRIALLDEVLEAFPGVVLNLDIKQTAPVVDALRSGPGRPAPALRAHRRRHRGLVPRRGHRRLLDLGPGRPDLGRAPWRWPRFYQAVQAGEDPGTPAPRGPPGADHVRRPDHGRRALRRRAPTQQGLAVHVWTIEEETEMERLCGLGVDGIITDRPPPWSASSTTSGARGIRCRLPGEVRSVGAGGQPGLGRTRSAATAVRLLAVVGLLLGAQLALVGSFRHSPAMDSADPALSNSHSWPGQAGDAGELALCDGDVLAAAEVADTLRRAVQGPARPRRLSTGPWSCPAPGSVHTWGMRFPIDVAFCDRDMVVLDVRSALAVSRPGGGGR